MDNLVVCRGFSGIKQEEKVNMLQTEWAKKQVVWKQEKPWPSRQPLTICDQGRFCHWQWTANTHQHHLHWFKGKIKMPIYTFGWKAKHKHLFSMQNCPYKSINGPCLPSSQIPNPATATEKSPGDGNYRGQTPTSNSWNRLLPQDPLSSHPTTTHMSQPQVLPFIRTPPPSPARRPVPLLCAFSAMHTHHGKHTTF